MIIAIGDIHGNFQALDDLLKRIRPDIRSEDVLVFLGDYIDRGPDTKCCVERIIALQRESCCQVVTLLGNHEQWMLRSLQDPTRHSWLISMDAFETISSYSESAALSLRRAFEDTGPRLLTEATVLPYHLFFDRLPVSHLEFFLRLQPYYRSGEVLCVHGGADLQGRPPEQTDEETLVWGTSGWPDEYSGTHTVVYGHWDNSAPGLPIPYAPGNRTFGLDTISHGVLTAMRFPDKKLYQSGR
jgi:calcineurin-like phosphoesterase family protein